MILRVTRLPLPGERNDGVSPILKAAEHLDILGYVRNRRGVFLGTVRVLEHEGGRERR